MKLSLETIKSSFLEDDLCLEDDFAFLLGFGCLLIIRGTHITLLQ